MNRKEGMDRFLWMTCFARAVETGSFSAAGRDLGLGQPNVSRYVAALEEHLQTRLLHRSTRKLSLTPEGERYSVEDVRAVARHELGHALGLAHHAAPTSVMAPLVRAERLTDEDRATLRALYALPIGARCTLPPSTPGA